MSMNYPHKDQILNWYIKFNEYPIDRIFSKNPYKIVLLLLTQIEHGPRNSMRFGPFRIVHARQ